MYTFLKRNQSKVFGHLKSNVNRKNILIQLDFSQNAALLHQNEIQSAHWVHTQIIVFTAYAWIDMDPMAESFVAVCDMFLEFHNLSAKFV